VLVNNAGVALGGTFLEIAERDFEWLFDINFWGVVRMTRAFLPHLQKSEEAWLVNISSLFGLIAPPGQTAYARANLPSAAFLKRCGANSSESTRASALRLSILAASPPRLRKVRDSRIVSTPKKWRSGGSFSILT